MIIRLRGWFAQLLRDQLPLLTVLAVVVLAALLVANGRWRRGALVLGVAALGAAVLRLCLPAARAGLLVVRSKTFDVWALAVTGTLIVFLAATIDKIGVG